MPVAGGSCPSVPKVGRIPLFDRLTAIIERLRLRDVSIIDGSIPSDLRRRPILWKRAGLVKIIPRRSGRRLSIRRYEADHCPWAIAVTKCRDRRSNKIGIETDLVSGLRGVVCRVSTEYSTRTQIYNRAPLRTNRQTVRRADN